MLTVPKTKEDLQKLIATGVEENLHLDYKDARSLLPETNKNSKREIAKDVSAMANSAGGIIIYGIKQYDDPQKEHLPEKITPLDRRKVSREWLEQVINSNISPRVEGLLVHPISLDQPHEVVYAVETPQSTTAHQNTIDGRYYRRYNFQSVWMVDYEIRDIMNRGEHPIIELGFQIEKTTYKVDGPPGAKALALMTKEQAREKEYRTEVTLRIFPANIGTVFAQFVNYFVQLPDDIVNSEEARHLKRAAPGLIEFYGENTHRDVVDVQYVAGNPLRKYGPSRFDPVLPGLNGRSEKLLLVQRPRLEEREVVWKVHDDNARPRNGRIKLNEIPLTEKKDG